MRSRLYVILILQLCSLLACGALSAKEAEAANPSFNDIRFITHSPFLFDVLNQERPPQSPMNAAHMALFKQMKFKPAVELTVTSRIIAALSEETPACAFMIVKSPEREAAFDFSLPTDYLLSHRLYQTTDTPPLPAELLNDDNELASLRALFSYYPQRKLMLLKDRSHGALLDAQIADLPDSVKYYRWGSHQYDSDIQMLVRERGEYILAYPYDIQREAQNYPEITFQSAAIAGNSAIKTGHMMCNRNPDTADFLSTVNDALRKLYHQPVFLEAHLKFNDPSAHDALRLGLKKLQQL